jgi:hypothetical protein
VYQAADLLADPSVVGRLAVDLWGEAAAYPCLAADSWGEAAAYLCQVVEPEYLSAEGCLLAAAY